MNSTELMRCMNNDFWISKNKFGVYPRNHFPGCETAGLYILNTDDSGSPGTHWLLVYVSEDCKKYIFDSLALRGAYRKNLLRALGGRYTLITNWRLQPDNSRMCGGYALYFARRVARAGPVEWNEGFLSPFSRTRLRANDEIIVDFLWKNFSYFLPGEEVGGAYA